MKALVIVAATGLAWCSVSVAAALFWGAVCALNDGDGLGEGDL